MNRSVFKRLAEKHQEEFKANVLKLSKCGMFKNPHTKELVPIQRFLADEDAEAGMIFYEGFRKEILAVAKGMYDFHGRHKSMYVDMLRSEHIPFNIFIPMGIDNDTRRHAAFIFNKFLVNSRITSVDEILIEDDRFCDNEDYLNDKTAFDAYIAYTSMDGKRGGIGIEVKYTEASYEIGVKEKGYCIDDNSPYWNISRWSGCFTDDPDKVKTDNDFRQIWRNHLLGLSMMKNNQIDYFTHIHLYPKENGHFEKILPVYEKELLTDKGRTSFRAVTFETLFNEMGREYRDGKNSKWVDYLKERYLFSCR